MNSVLVKPISELEGLLLVETLFPCNQSHPPPMAETGVTKLKETHFLTRTFSYVSPNDPRLHCWTCVTKAVRCASKMWRV